MKDDSFTEIWNLQKKLGDRIFEERNIQENDEFLRNVVVAMSVECSELLTELQYKWWKDKKSIDRSKILEESIDILHFLLQFWISAKFSPEDVINAFKEKNKKNFKRFFSD
ncbi:MAG: dUTPase [Candidatus Helarchaeota archaeon]